MAITVKRTDLAGHDKYAIVEPNHLSAPRDGGVYAQLPAKSDIKVLEQGTFVKYDLAKGMVDFDGKGPWMMVFNEEKLYDERKQMHRDYAMTKEKSNMVPRVFRLSVGDIYTTNNVKEEALTVGDTLVPGEQGILEKKAAPAATDTLVCTVVKETTLPDGELAVKLQVTRAE